jgi:excisionase family DNA binding protein
VLDVLVIWTHPGLYGRALGGMMADVQAGNLSPTGYRFYTVPEAARILRVSAMTLYRSIAANEFPAVRIRTRLLVPATLVDGMVDAAMERGGVVDVSEWRLFRSAS